MNRCKVAAVQVLQRTLPLRIRNALFHLSFHLARREYETFAQTYSFAPDMEHSLRAAARLGLAPATVIDVGAFEGDWSRLSRSIWPSSSLIMIEPNEQKRSRLQSLAAKLNAQLISELLGAQDGRAVDFFLMESGSSVLEERSPLSRSVQRRTLRTLDSVIDKIEAPGLLKIDAQGYELEILKGASRLMPSLEAVLLEVAILEINKGAPLLHEVVAFMKSAGFVTYDIAEIHRRPLDRALNQIDVLFVREHSALIADKRHYATN
ncbi:MAG TPA: FkbM family methyltransferase [Steroidobacteraceae bacterium]|nr:FkbM family methyltransferase [Steroidobacteraceae bacterium]